MYISGKFNLLFLLCLGYSCIIYGQDCQIPVLTGFTAPTTDGFTITWEDNNADVEHYEIEFDKKGFQRSFTADVSDIQDRMYIFENLESGVTYELYIRAVCSGGDMSLWNGPYFYSTVIDNQAGCPLTLDIADNNCLTGNEFLIEVKGYPDHHLGEDLVFDRLEVWIDHPWPPDLSLALRSPAGRRIILSEFNGNGADDYGMAGNAACQNPAVFTDNACLSVKEFTPPFTGEFKPEQPLGSLSNGISPNGTWILEVCDRAQNDLGVLTGVRLVFSEVACILPQAFILNDIDGDHVSIQWDDQASCENMRISYKKKGAPVSETSSEFVVCSMGSFVLPGLLPSTEYELTVTAQCDEDTNSPVSCIYNFTTLCSNATQLEDFDNQSSCAIACDMPCSLFGTWHNAHTNQSDWLLSQEATMTSFTGPEGDKNNSGGFIYIENQTNLCSEELFIDLESECLSNPDTTGCQLSFYYHMYGEDIGALKVELSTDSSRWEEIWHVEGEQGDAWKQVALDIPPFSYGRLRFRAYKKTDAVRGDIALDHIKLIGMDTIEPARYYRDADEDGFGNPDIFILSCSPVISPGYVDNNSDCNDDDSSINPAAIEIVCNNVDENCNGLADDVVPDGLEYTVSVKKNESCAGTADGMISLEILNGTPPYRVQWSAGPEGASISGLSAGVYTAIITDANGCATETMPIVINSDQVLLYSVAAADNPTCQGIDDGLIELLVGGGTGPYDIEWNTGAEGLAIESLPAGDYTATITDAQGCALVTSPVKLSAQPVIVAGVSLKRDVSCFGGDNGFIQLGISGGQAPYEIEWNTGHNGFVISDLSAGMYSVTIYDTGGCNTQLGNIEVNEPDSLELTLSNIEHITCNDGFDSFIDIRVSGGQKPYSYIWSNGMFSEDIYDVPAGSYSVTVTDFNACSAVLNGISVNEPPPLQLQVDSISSVECKASSDGYIEVSVSGGNPPYGYSWSTDEGDISDSPVLENLLPGQYYLTVVDNFGCKSRAYTFDIINEAVPINISLNTISGILCFGDSTASISAVSDENRFPLDFNWSNGAKRIKNTRADTLFGLPAGRYNVTITDSEGCVGISDTIRLDSPGELGYTLIEKLDNPCSGDSMGKIQIVPSGGTPPYMIEWSNNMTGNTLSGLPNGAYTLSLTDANACHFQSQPININSPLPLVIKAEVITGSGNDGVIMLHPSGGTPPYRYFWDPLLPDTRDSIATNLPSGEYHITVTDQRGCASDTIIIIESTDALPGLNTDVDVSVYPNPASDFIYFKLENSDVKEVSLYNIHGQYQKCTSTVPVNGKGMIDTTCVPSGVYIICFKTLTSAFCRKVVIL